MPDDYSADTQTTGLLTPDGPASGEIETIGDRDWLRLEVTDPYQLHELTPSNVKLLSIRDAGGTLLPAWAQIPAQQGPGWHFDFFPPAAGTYFLELGQDFDPADETEGGLGAYDVTLDLHSHTEEPAGPNFVAEFQEHDPYFGAIDEPLDIDWLRFRATAAVDHVIRLEAWQDMLSYAVPSTRLLFASIRDVNGTVIEGIGPSQLYDGDRIVFRPEASGTYYLEVTTGSDEENVWNSTYGSYLISLTRMGNLEDTYVGSGDAVEIDLSGGNDTAQAWAGDTIHGGDGDDLLSAWFLSGALHGDAGDDVLIGTGSHRRVYDGGTGYDLIRAGSNNDRIHGGPQADTITAGAGNDSVTGGNGRDLASLGLGNDLYTDAPQLGVYGADTVIGDRGNDTVTGLGGRDSLSGEQGDDSLSGGDGADWLHGGRGQDRLYGGSGNDAVTGGLGNDDADLGTGWDRWIDHAQADGHDTVEGGTGWDRIESQGGDDWLTGGAGADTFVLGPGIGDLTITDFAAGEDRLEIAASLWNGPLTASHLDSLDSSAGDTLMLVFDTGGSVTFAGLGSELDLFGDIAVT